MSIEAQEKIDMGERIALRSLLWHHGIYKETEQDKIIDSLFFAGYHKRPDKPPSLLSVAEIQLAIKSNMTVDIYQKVALAQRKADIKHYTE